MRTKIAFCAALSLALLVGSALTFESFAQAKSKQASKTTNIQGKVGKVDNDTVTILVGNTPKPVMINGDTKFIMGHTTDNKPGSIGAIKQGDFISCTVSTDAKSNFIATQCLYRDKP